MGEKLQMGKGINEREGVQGSVFYRSGRRYSGEWRSGIGEKIFRGSQEKGKLGTYHIRIRMAGLKVSRGAKNTKEGRHRSQTALYNR